ncbi:hypothetical protein ABEO75_30025 [Paenibacillus macerans]|uniref:hypothetical protein n=1 Tax=Paenibacillus macerans TaxID=44252 RepID=UPI002E23105F|nr:hypothetical protein [Paenibacillus macerans]
MKPETAGKRYKVRQRKGLTRKCSYVFAAVSPAASLLQVFLIVLSEAPLYSFESEKERSLALFGVCSQSQEYNKLCRMMWKNEKESVLVGFG